MLTVCQLWCCKRHKITLRCTEHLSLFARREQLHILHGSSHISLCLAPLPVIFGERSTRLVDTVRCGLPSWDLETYEHSLKDHQCGWCAGHPVAEHRRQHSYKGQNVGFEIRGLGIELYLFHYQPCNWASYLNSLHSFYHLIR